MALGWRERDASFLTDRTPSPPAAVKRADYSSLESLESDVEPTPATHAMLTQLTVSARFRYRV